MARSAGSGERSFSPNSSSVIWTPSHQRNQGTSRIPRECGRCTFSRKITAALERGVHDVAVGAGVALLPEAVEDEPERPEGEREGSKALRPGLPGVDAIAEHYDHPVRRLVIGKRIRQAPDDAREPLQRHRGSEYRRWVLVRAIVHRRAGLALLALWRIPR